MGRRARSLPAPGSPGPSFTRSDPSPPVQPRLRSSRPAPVRFSPAPARSCQPLTGLFRPTSANLLSVSARPVPPRSPFPSATECFCQPLTGLLRPTSVNLLSVSARLRPPRLRPSRLRSSRPVLFLPALDRAAPAHLCQPPVRLCPSRLRSSRPVPFLPALDRAAPAHLCQPPVRLRPPRLVLPPFRPLRPAFGCFYPHRSFRAGAVPLPLRGRAASRGAEVPAKTVITQNGVRERVPAGVYNLFIKIAAPRWPFGRSAVSLFTCKVSPPAPADAG